MAMDQLAATARAAGYAMVGSEELLSEPALRQSPDVPAPRIAGAPSFLRARPITTALVPVTPSTSFPMGWSFFWKATA